MGVLFIWEAGGVGWDGGMLWVVIDAAGRCGWFFGVRKDFLYAM